MQIPSTVHPITHLTDVQLTRTLVVAYRPESQAIVVVGIL